MNHELVVSTDSGNPALVLICVRRAPDDRVDGSEMCVIHLAKLLVFSLCYTPNYPGLVLAATDDKLTSRIEIECPDRRSVAPDSILANPLVN